MTGFSNWKDTTRSFTRHESTTAHKAATDLLVKIPLTTGDVGDMLSSAHTKEKASNQKCLVKVAENIRYLSRQGIAFRGDGDEVDSNFLQLMHLRALDDPDLVSFLSKETKKYSSPQNSKRINQDYGLADL